jgi:integrase
MISALKDRPDLQLLVALCGFLGLRPSEASGLAWDCVDLTTGQLHIRRGVVRNVVGDLKTAGSSASLPLIEPVGPLLELVRKNGAGTWVFENSAGKPTDLKAIVWRFIKPAIEKWNSETKKENQIRWLGLYGLRRSAASLLWSLTGDTHPCVPGVSADGAPAFRQYLPECTLDQLVAPKRLDRQIP